MEDFFMQKWYDTEISQGILKSKYYHPDESDPQTFMDRVCSIFSTDVKKAMRGYLEEASVCPAGRTLYAAGAKGKFKGSLSNCYILPSPEDNIESIFKTNEEIAKIFSYGGGIGVNISRLRPKDSKVNNVARTSTGAVSFLKIFDATGEVISQNGRRGAMMVGLDCNHPDIYEFLHMKQNNEKLASMNISILFTDEFMRAVVNGEDYELSFDVEASGEKIRQKINASQFFDEYCRTQWDWGDPGAIFRDRMNGYSLLAGYDDYTIDITNPCGEFGGNAYNSCNLMSINLYNFIDDKFTDNPKLNEDAFKTAVHTSIRALDEVLDYGYETQPLDENRKCIDDWRSVGLGLFAVADALVAMKLKYGSKKANEFVAKVMRIMLTEAARTSAELAGEKKPFGRYNWECTEKSPIIQLLKTEAPDVYELIKKNGLRNGTLLSIAPTGTISLLMGTFSGGCEPLYQISYERSTHKMEEQHKSFKVYAHSVKDLLDYHRMSYDTPDDEIKRRFPWIIESHDVPYQNRVKLQAAMQKYVDNSISSTVNLKHDATPEDIRAIYIAAWKSNCKGITVFRDGCKRGNILGVSTPEDEPQEIRYDSLRPAKRDHIRRIEGVTLVRRTSCVDKMYVTVNKTPDGHIFEIFTNASGGCQSNIATITRLASLALRCGISVEDIIKQMSTVKCSACQALIRSGRKDISLSCGSAIASCLAEVYAETKKNDHGEKPVPNASMADEGKNFVKPKMAVQPAVTMKKAAPEEKDDEVPDWQAAVTRENAAINRQCPECGHYTLRPEGNCVTCSYCGWSKCE